MMKKARLITTLGFLTCSTLSFAGIAPMPQTGFFFGLGGSYNSVQFDQNLYLQSSTFVDVGGTEIAFGMAGGHHGNFNATQSAFAPQAQIGYMMYTPCCDWLWGAKLTYQYLGVTITDPRIGFGAADLLHTTDDAPVNTTFAASVSERNAQATTKSEIALLAFVGRPFSSGYAYLGAGPIVINSQYEIDAAVASIAVNNTTGPVVTNGGCTGGSSSKWIWGGVAQIGLTYYVDPTWFLDFNYSYAYTTRVKFNNNEYSSNSTAGFHASSYVYSTASERLITQSFAITINKVF